MPKWGLETVYPGKNSKISMDSEGNKRIVGD